MAQTDYDDMHGEHRDWSRQHAAWLRDTSRWQRENEQALRRLDAIAVNLRERDAQLKAHIQRIRAHEALSRNHERVMAEQMEGAEQGRRGVLDRAMATRHTHENAAHQSVAAEHAEYGERHTEIIALIEQLRVLLQP